MTRKQGFLFSHVADKLRVLALTLITAGASTFALADSHPEPGKGSVLALGDSVVFGYITAGGYTYGNASNFIGYPDYVGSELGLQVANASCPGETTGGFISPTQPDNGCRPFRANFPLHAAYGGTQLAYATHYLSTHKKTRLVTVGLGANDGFLLIQACGGVPACIQAGLPAALGAVYANLNTILGNLRASGHRGVLMVVNYYSTDYTDQAGTGLTYALNQTLAAAAAANGAVVADAFSAFLAAASTPAAGGNTCKAGLLNASPANPYVCDVHPSQSGQMLLARTVAATYARVARRDD